MNLNDIINELDVKEDYIFYDDIDEYVCVKKPKFLDDLPIMNINLITNNNKKEEDNDSEKEDSYIKLFSLDNINNYFNELIDHENGLGIRVLNGINLRLNYSFFSYECDYCKDTIKRDWFYCLHCHKDMCKLCYSELNEEIAVKNGSVNYKKREEQLNLCRGQNLLIPRDIYMSIKKFCNICKEGNIKYDTCIYSKYINDYIHSDGIDSYDICEECFSNKEDVKQILKTDSEFKLYKYKYIFDYSGFNSLLYWVPLLKDTNNNLVLINLNPEDENYKKICLVSKDDHGRYGYYILNKLEGLDSFENINTTIETILVELNNIIQENKNNLLKGHYSFPIHYLMDKYDIQIYYG